MVRFAHECIMQTLFQPGAKDKTFAYGADFAYMSKSVHMTTFAHMSKSHMSKFAYMQINTYQIFKSVQVTGA